MKLSDASQRLRFMLPSAEQSAASMSKYGVGDGAHVVLYDGAMNMWAARVWWLLRAFGFENARVLSGGLRKWKAEGRPLSTEPSAYPPASFVARPRPGLMATTQEVLAAINDGGTCIIDALSEDQFAGRMMTYGRPGHIPWASSTRKRMRTSRWPRSRLCSR